MAAPKELEIKLTLPAADLPRLQKLPLVRAAKASVKHKSQVSVYFDTDKHKLRKHGLTLRVRRTDNRHIQTIKATHDAHIFARDEWEAETADGQPDLALAADTALAPLIDGKLHRQLKPMFETRVRRSIYPLARNGGAIAMAVDQGTIETGERSGALCEVELELERGSEADLFEVARELARALPAQLSLRSKSERGYELLSGGELAAVKFEGVSLAAGTRTRDTFGLIGRACLRQITANESALLNGDAEGVHQMRVGLRRLRAAISLFGAILDDGETAAIKRELKWLTGELAPARELEVLIKRVVAPVKKRRSREQGVSSLSRQFAERRASALDRAREAINSARFRLFALDVAAWLEIGQWRSPQDDLVLDSGDRPIEMFAAEQLERRFRKLRKKRKAFAKLDPLQKHKLRIQAKKLRYAADFFADLFAGKPAARRKRKFLDALERIQDAFGDLNDITVDQKMIRSTRKRTRQAAQNGAFAAGLLTGREDARLDSAMAKATAAYAGFAKAKAFWR
jgi:inorganic triphosphatase YgiF